MCMHNLCDSFATINYDGSNHKYMKGFNISYLPTKKPTMDPITSLMFRYVVMDLYCCVGLWPIQMGGTMSCNPRNPLFLLCPPPYCLQEGELLLSNAFQLRNVSMNPLLNRQRHSMNSQINCAIEELKIQSSIHSSKFVQN